MLGTIAASTLFAVALLASGQSSTITGTLAWQVVMEGFMHWRMKPWLRRMITRTPAILPAVFVIGLRGESSVTDLLTLSQVVLALQLPFFMFPLLQFTSSGKRMGKWKERMVSAERWMGQCYPDHRDGRLRPARIAQNCVACHHWRVTRHQEIKSTMYNTPYWSRLDGTPTDWAIHRAHQEAGDTGAQPPGAAAHRRRLERTHVPRPAAVSPEISEDIAYLQKVQAEFEEAGIPAESELRVTGTLPPRSSSG